MVLVKIDTDSNMELASIPRVYTAPPQQKQQAQVQEYQTQHQRSQQHLKLPLRTLQPRYVHSSNGLTSREYADSPHLSILPGRRTSESVMMESSMRSPTWSQHSQDSYTEYDAAASTAPSSPPEFPDSQSQYFPSRRPSLQLAPLDFTVENLPPLRRGSPIPMLPKLESLFRKPPQASSSLVAASQQQQQLDRKIKLSPSPEPQWSSTNTNYVLSTDLLPHIKRQALGERRDQILDALNHFRKSRARDSRWEKLDTPDGINLDIKIDLSTPRWFNHALRPHIDAGIRKRRPNQSNCNRRDPHCNKRYTKEQRDYIRYHHHDTKKHWPEIKDMFYSMFPDPDFVRNVQGIQGVYYRDNKDIPNLDVHTNMIEYEENGHSLSIEKKVRDQAEHKAKWGLVNLFPEFAVKYSWVLPEHRQRAAELSVLRRKAREEAKNRAIVAGTWEPATEKPCGCCNLQRSKYF